jgi:hypothetical protein
MGDTRAVFAVCLLLAATSHAGPTPAPCARYAPRPVRLARAPAEVEEMSGLAASRRHPAIYWTHNDSGKAFELLALRADGSLLARFPLTGGANVDCEDLAIGPCQETPAQSCLYLADIGDNLERRPRVVVYEIPEPATLTPKVLAARALPFTYPDGPHNAEAVLVDPDDGRLYVITKVIDSLGTLYRVDGLGTAGKARAVRLHRLSAPSGFAGLTTGAAVHPSGTRVLLRTYTQVWEYRGTPKQSLAAIMASTPVTVPGATQPQAEAVTYTSDGTGYLLGTEQLGPLYRVDCARSSTSRQGSRRTDQRGS